MSFKEFKPYPKYKDSGVEWLGEIPEHWRVMLFFTQAQERKETNKGMLESNLLSLSYGRIVPKDINTHEGLLPESFESYQIVHPDDIVFRLTDLQNDKRSLRSAICKELGIITSAYLVVRTQGLDSNYLNYLMRSYDVMKVFYSMGGGMRQSMKFDDLKRLPLIVPTTLEQSAIASFLHQETSRIDTLISEKERLISFLQEYRQALISHAVTKGLDPKVKMKDSGVEWLGEIPEHWEITRLKHISAVVMGQSPASEDCNLDSNGLPFLQGCAEFGESFPTPKQYCDVAKKFAQNGDILFSVRAPVGSINIANQIYGIGRGLCAIRPISVDSKFLQWTISYHKKQLDAIATGSTYDSVTVNEVQGIFVVVPTSSEQLSIATFLDQETSRIDTLISEARKFIDLLKEYRSTLISEAVTGKINVLDEVGSS